MNVEALVKCNNELAVVTKEKINLKYNRHGKIIIGMDDSNTFISCYEYEYSRYEKAFGGRKFDIKIENGKPVHCEGDWWDSGYGDASAIIGKDLIPVAVCSKKSLKKCYVFNGMYAVKEKVEALISGYMGKIYEYQEYRDLIKE